MFHQIQASLNQIAAQHAQTQQTLQQCITQFEQQLGTLRAVQQQEAVEGQMIRNLSTQVSVTGVSATLGSPWAYGAQFATTPINPGVTGVGPIS